MCSTHNPHTLSALFSWGGGGSHTTWVIPLEANRASTMLSGGRKCHMVECIPHHRVWCQLLLAPGFMPRTSWSQHHVQWLWGIPRRDHISHQCPPLLHMVPAPIAHHVGNLHPETNRSWQHARWLRTMGKATLVGAFTTAMNNA